MQRLSPLDPVDFPNTLARYDQAGVCPYVFVSQWVREFIASRRWFESGNIGFSFLEAPQWYLEALSLHDTESSRAMSMKQKEGDHGRKRKQNN
jgi:hypothetical protein